VRERVVASHVATQRKPMTAGTALGLRIEEFWLREAGLAPLPWLQPRTRKMSPRAPLDVTLLPGSRLPCSTYPGACSLSVFLGGQTLAPVGDALAVTIPAGTLRIIDLTLDRPLGGR
jgi:hypothetical protein